MTRLLPGPQPPGEIFGKTSAEQRKARERLTGRKLVVWNRI